MGEEISAQEAERRVLILNNPGVEGFSATHSLFAGLQLLLSGEVANRHRHSQSALRFVIEGDGAYTSVDGERIDMHRGDLILTPSFSWHDHGKTGDGPMIWLDGVDVPIVNSFGATFLESYPTHEAGLMPLDETSRGSKSSGLSYPYENAHAALEAKVAAETSDPYLGVKMRYTNSRTGGHVLPTMACFLQHLPAAFKGANFRATDASVNLVLEGTGRVWIGETCLEWGPNDVFVLPNWSWYRFEADSKAEIFSYSDRAAQERLGLYQEEKSTI
jgi:gentisate 1,2-dioxygenase